MWKKFFVIAVAIGLLLSLQFLSAIWSYLHTLSITLIVLIISFVLVPDFIIDSFFSFCVTILLKLMGKKYVAKLSIGKISLRSLCVKDVDVVLKDIHRIPEITISLKELSVCMQWGRIMDSFYDYLRLWTSDYIYEEMADEALNPLPQSPKLICLEIVGLRISTKTADFSALHPSPKRHGGGTPPSGDEYDVFSGDMPALDRTIIMQKLLQRLIIHTQLIIRCTEEAALKETPILSGFEMDILLPNNGCRVHGICHKVEVCFPKSSSSSLLVAQALFFGGQLQIIQTCLNSSVIGEEEAMRLRCAHGGVKMIQHLPTKQQDITASIYESAEYEGNEVVVHVQSLMELYRKYNASQGEAVKLKQKQNLLVGGKMGIRGECANILVHVRDDRMPGQNIQFIAHHVFMGLRTYLLSREGKRLLRGGIILHGNEHDRNINAHLQRGDMSNLYRCLIQRTFTKLQNRVRRGPNKEKVMYMFAKRVEVKQIGNEPLINKVCLQGAWLMKRQLVRMCMPCIDEDVVRAGAGRLDFFRISPAMLDWFVVAFDVVTNIPSSVHGHKKNSLMTFEFNNIHFSTQPIKFDFSPTPLNQLRKQKEGETNEDYEQYVTSIHAQQLHSISQIPVDDDAWVAFDLTDFILEKRRHYDRLDSIFDATIRHFAVASTLRELELQNRYNINTESHVTTGDRWIGNRWVIDNFHMEFLSKSRIVWKHLSFDNLYASVSIDVQDPSSEYHLRERIINPRVSVWHDQIISVEKLYIHRDNDQLRGSISSVASTVASASMLKLQCSVMMISRVKDRVLNRLKYMKNIGKRQKDDLQTWVVLRGEYATHYRDFFVKQWQLSTTGHCGCDVKDTTDEQQSNTYRVFDKQRQRWTHIHLISNDCIAVAEFNMQWMQLEGSQLLDYSLPQGLELGNICRVFNTKKKSWVYLQILESGSISIGIPASSSQLEKFSVRCNVDETALYNVVDMNTGFDQYQLCISRLNIQVPVDLPVLYYGRKMELEREQSQRVQSFTVNKHRTNRMNRKRTAFNWRWRENMDEPFSSDNKGQPFAAYINDSSYFVDRTEKRIRMFFRSINFCTNRSERRKSVDCEKTWIVSDAMPEKPMLMVKCWKLQEYYDAITADDDGFQQPNGFSHSNYDLNSDASELRKFCRSLAIDQIKVSVNPRAELGIISDIISNQVSAWSAAHQSRSSAFNEDVAERMDAEKVIPAELLSHVPSSFVLNVNATSLCVDCHHNDAFLEDFAVLETKAFCLEVDGTKSMLAIQNELTALDLGNTIFTGASLEKDFKSKRNLRAGLAVSHKFAERLLHFYTGISGGRLKVCSLEAVSISCPGIQEASSHAAMHPHFSIEERSADPLLLVTDLKIEGTLYSARIMGTNIPIDRITDVQLTDSLPVHCTASQKVMSDIIKWKQGDDTFDISTDDMNQMHSLHDIAYDSSITAGIADDNRPNCAAIHVQNKKSSCSSKIYSNATIEMRSIYVSADMSLFNTMTSLHEALKSCGALNRDNSLTLPMWDHLRYMWHGNVTLNVDKIHLAFNSYAQNKHIGSLPCRLCFAIEQLQCFVDCSTVDVATSQITFAQDKNIRQDELHGNIGTKFGSRQNEMSTILHVPALIVSLLHSAEHPSNEFSSTSYAPVPDATANERKLSLEQRSSCPDTRSRRASLRNDATYTHHDVYLDPCIPKSHVSPGSDDGGLASSTEVSLYETFSVLGQRFHRLKYVDNDKYFNFRSMPMSFRWDVEMRIADRDERPIWLHFELEQIECIHNIIMMIKDSFAVSNDSSRSLSVDKAEDYQWGIKKSKAPGSLLALVHKIQMQVVINKLLISSWSSSSDLRGFVFAQEKSEVQLRLMRVPQELQDSNSGSIESNDDWTVPPLKPDHLFIASSELRLYMRKWCMSKSTTGRNSRNRSHTEIQQRDIAPCNWFEITSQFDVHCRMLYIDNLLASLTESGKLGLADSEHYLSSTILLNHKDRDEFITSPTTRARSVLRQESDNSVDETNFNQYSFLIGKDSFLIGKEYEEEISRGADEATGRGIVALLARKARRSQDSLLKRLTKNSASQDEISPLRSTRRPGLYARVSWRNRDTNVPFSRSAHSVRIDETKEAVTTFGKNVYGLRAYGTQLLVTARIRIEVARYADVLKKSLQRLSRKDYSQEKGTMGDGLSRAQSVHKVDTTVASKASDFREYQQLSEIDRETEKMDILRQRSPSNAVSQGGAHGKGVRFNSMESMVNDRDTEMERKILGCPSQTFFRIELLGTQVNFLDTKTHTSFLVTARQSSTLSGKRFAYAAVPAVSDGDVENSSPTAAATPSSLQSQQRQSKKIKKNDFCPQSPLDCRLSLRDVVAYTAPTRYPSSVAHEMNRVKIMKSSDLVLWVTMNVPNKEELLKEVGGHCFRQYKKVSSKKFTIQEANVEELNSPLLKKIVEELDVQAVYTTWQLVDRQAAKNMPLFQLPPGRVMDRFRLNLPFIRLDLLKWQKAVLQNFLRNVLLASPNSSPNKSSKLKLERAPENVGRPLDINSSTGQQEVAAIVERMLERHQRGMELPTNAKKPLLTQLHIDRCVMILRLPQQPGQRQPMALELEWTGIICTIAFDRRMCYKLHLDVQRIWITECMEESVSIMQKLASRAARDIDDDDAADDDDEAAFRFTSSTLPKTSTRNYLMESFAATDKQSCDDNVHSAALSDRAQEISILFPRSLQFLDSRRRSIRNEICRRCGNDFNMFTNSPDSCYFHMDKYGNKGLYCSLASVDERGTACAVMQYSCCGRTIEAAGGCRQGPHLHEHPMLTVSMEGYPPALLLYSNDKKKVQQIDVTMVKNLNISFFPNKRLEDYCLGIGMKKEIADALGDFFNAAEHHNAVDINAHDSLTSIGSHDKMSSQDELDQSVDTLPAYPTAFPEMESGHAGSHDNTSTDSDDSNSSTNNKKLLRGISSFVESTIFGKKKRIRKNEPSSGHKHVEEEKEQVRIDRASDILRQESEDFVGKGLKTASQEKLLTYACKAVVVSDEEDDYGINSALSRSGSFDDADSSSSIPTHQHYETESINRTRPRRNSLDDEIGEVVLKYSKKKTEVFYINSFYLGHLKMQVSSKGFLIELHKYDLDVAPLRTRFLAQPWKQCVGRIKMRIGLSIAKSQATRNWKTVKHMVGAGARDRFQVDDDASDSTKRKSIVGV